LSTRYRKLDITSFENLLLGAALADEGKYRTSLQFYERAVKTSADAADTAAALRVHGRALIASGRPRRGRRRMRKAARMFSAWSRARGYDDEKMNYESADTYARLVRTQLRWNYRKKTRADLADFRRSIARIKDPHGRQSMEEVLAEITGTPRTPAEPAAVVPPSPTPTPAAAVPAAPHEISEPSPGVIGPTGPAEDETRRSSPPVSTAEMPTH